MGGWMGLPTGVSQAFPPAWRDPFHGRHVPDLFIRDVNLL